ncbi:hypothetical protein B0H14DRAFT_2589450 [Mycena olivaceomarginata]|nr:hypothetical protein B0H14DRAFT_2589450 [Mycena olivaceomarginata]
MILEGLPFEEGKHEVRSCDILAAKGSGDLLDLRLLGVRRHLRARRKSGLPTHYPGSWGWGLGSSEAIVSAKDFTSKYIPPTLSPQPRNVRWVGACAEKLKQETRNKHREMLSIVVEFIAASLGSLKCKLKKAPGAFDGRAGRKAVARTQVIILIFALLAVSDISHAITASGLGWVGSKQLNLTASWRCMPDSSSSMTGSRQPTLFTEDAFEDIYRNHVTAIELNRRDAPKATHKLLHGLFNQVMFHVSTSSPRQITSAAAKPFCLPMVTVRELVILLIREENTTCFKFKRSL